MTGLGILNNDLLVVARSLPVEDGKIVIADVDGELLILDHQGGGKGGFYRLEPSPPRESSRPFPRKLSETGLFKSVPGHVVQPSLIPYSVNAPLWSDGAIKKRYLAMMC